MLAGTAVPISLENNGVYVYDNIPDGAVRKSRVHGLGLFAVKDVENGSVLAVLTGQIVPVDVVRAMDTASMKKLLFESEWNMFGSENFMLRYFPTKYGFINHSEKHANVSLLCNFENTTVSLIATRKIFSGEELFLNYLDEPLPSEYLEMSKFLKKR